MTKFSTLSPVPGFRAWLANELKRPESKLLTEPEVEQLKGPLSKLLSGHGDSNNVPSQLASLIRANGCWSQDPDLVALLETPLMRAASRYLFLEKRRNYALNSVANFHLRNGATLWRINWLGDVSPRGMDNSCGIMVNYRYFLDQVDKNSNQYLVDHEIAAGEQVLQLASQAKQLLTS